MDFSPAQNLAVFNSIRDGDWEIYSAVFDGGDERRLTVQGRPGVEGIDGQPACSPSGDRIAITSGRAGSLDIVLIDANGHEIQNLTIYWRLETSSHPAF